MNDNGTSPLGLPEPQELDRVRTSAAPAHSYGYGGYTGDDGADENHVREYLRAVRKHMWLIIGIIYFIVIMALTKLSDRLEKRLVK